VGEASARSRLFAVKPVVDVTHEPYSEGEAVSHLRRTMGPVSLTFFSVGAIVGTGIYVILGEAVPAAGPAVLVSFVLAGLTALFSALSYAELAGALPVSGSAYSYTYATLGELVAWIVGWALVLEYGVSVAAVAVGWGQYLNEFFVTSIGLSIPDALSQPPGEGGYVNLPAIVVVLGAMVLLLRGTRESTRVNNILVVLKVVILLVFVVVAFTAFDSDNLRPFAPLGWAGITAGASLVFFSYIGFDAASTAGEEAKNPRRDLPVAILVSLVIVTALYLLVALAAVGAQHWQDFEGSGGEAVLAKIMRVVTGESWPAALLSFGAVISIASVVLTVMYGQTRILFAMSRDGLIPSLFSRGSRHSGVPTANTLVVGTFIAVLAGLVPLGALAEATSVGTLFAFMLVNIGVIILRRTRPDLPRTFRIPLFPFPPAIGVGFTIWLFTGFGGSTWVAFLVWLLAGLAFYATYGYRRSHLHVGGPYRTRTRR